jgi:Methyladenine glycosylase
MMLKRCAWALGSQQYIDYHDTEWGVPVHDDRKLFEMLILEGVQAGLSWSLILKKRVFLTFDTGGEVRNDAHFALEGGGSQACKLTSPPVSLLGNTARLFLNCCHTVDEVISQVMCFA